MYIVVYNFSKLINNEEIKQMNKQRSTSSALVGMNSLKLVYEEFISEYLRILKQIARIHRWRSGNP